MTNNLLSSGEVQFLNKLSHGKTLDKLFEGKGVFHSGIIIIRIISLVKRGYLAFEHSQISEMPRCVPTIMAERELVQTMFERDPFWSRR